MFTYLIVLEGDIPTKRLLFYFISLHYNLYLDGVQESSSF